MRTAVSALALGMKVCVCTSEDLELSLCTITYGDSFACFLTDLLTKPVLDLTTSCNQIMSESACFGILCTHQTRTGTRARLIAQSL
jgi:hypothetical protein